jgi:RNA polymerase sigma-70 factor (ECF subfamily)
MSISDAYPRPDFRPFAGSGLLEGLFEGRSSRHWPRIAATEDIRVQPVEPDQPFAPTSSGATCSDAVLLAAIAEGTSEAFQAFYERFGARVLSYARQLVGGHSERAEDLAQEVFLTVWRKAATFDAGRGDAAGWLYTIARNRFLDERRKAARSKEIDAELDLTHVAETPRGVGAELRVSLEKALSTLRADQRQALELAYFGGLTYEETALRLNLPVGTLKSRIRAALSSMRGFLGEPA